MGNKSSHKTKPDTGQDVEDVADSKRLEDMSESTGKIPSRINYAQCKFYDDISLYSNWMSYIFDFLDGIQLKVQKRENTFDVKETGVGDNAIPKSFPSDTKHNDNLDPGTIIIPN